MPIFRLGRRRINQQHPQIKQKRLDSAIAIIMGGSCQTASKAISDLLSEFAFDFRAAFLAAKALGIGVGRSVGRSVGARVGIVGDGVGVSVAVRRYILSFVVGTDEGASVPLKKIFIASSTSAHDIVSLSVAVEFSLDSSSSLASTRPRNPQ
jgi:hypothetical protein